MGEFYIFRVFVCTLLFEFVISGEYCVINNDLKYCDNDCCGDTCCGMSTATIVGLAVGGVMLLITAVGCILCLVCMCKNQHGRNSGVQPIHHNTNSVYVNNHPPPSQPPSYNQYSSYPSNSSNPAYSSYNDSVYPPGVVNSHPPPAYTYSEPSPRK